MHRADLIKKKFWHRINVEFITLRQRQKNDVFCRKLFSQLIQSWASRVTRSQNYDFRLLGCKHYVFDYLQESYTANKEYDTELPRQLRTFIKTKWTEKLTKGVLFDEDKVPAHRYLISITAGRDCGFELVDPLRILLICFDHTKFYRTKICPQISSWRRSSVSVIINLYMLLTELL